MCDSCREQCRSLPALGISDAEVSALTRRPATKTMQSAYTRVPHEMPPWHEGVQINVLLCLLEGKLPRSCRLHFWVSSFGNQII